MTQSLVGENVETDFFEKVIGQNPKAVLVTDRNGNIVYMNTIFSAISGYSFDELKGKNPRVLSAGETPPEVYQNLWQAIHAGKVWHGELCNRNKNGAAYWESISIAPLKDDQGVTTHFMGVWDDITDRKLRDEETASSLKEFERRSITDELTGQYNRRHILTELDKEMERVKRYGRKLSGLMIDIDNFKIINDRYGHPMGDRVIKTFARVIAKSIRKVDVLGRYGGDEFLVLLPEADLEIAKRVAERVQKNLAEYQETVIAGLGKLTASIGLLTFNAAQNGREAEFIERRDRALFQSKAAGKNTITVA